MKLVTQSGPELKKKEAQIQYCASRDIPFLALDQCPACGVDIWTLISLDEARTVHITGCPSCHVSYCE